MVASLANTVPVTLTIRANATNLIALKNALKVSFEDKSGPSYTEIIAKWAASRICAFPTIAERWN